MLKYTPKYKFKDIEIGWLEWVAPDSASTTSALSMTYSTPALLVRAGQGVFLFLFLFCFGCTWLSWSTHGHPWSPDWYSRCKTRGLQHFLLASSCASSSFLLWSSCSKLSNSPLTTDLRFPHLLTHLLPLLFSLTSLLCQAVPLMTKILHVLQHLLCLCHEGSGNGRTDRTTQSHSRRGMARLQEGNWHKERISS